ncbi:MAG: AMP-binding protein [Acidimicrobiia bacterium]
MSRFRSTYRHPGARAYAEPGGSWDGPTLDALLHSRARATNDVLVVDEAAGVRLTGIELEHRVAALAGGLRALGVRRRDVVAWQLPNGHEALLLTRACWRLGAVAAPIHHQAGAAEVERMLRTLEPRVALARDDVRGVASRFDTLFAGLPAAAGVARPADLAAVLFTSGSSGAPKAVLHTHRGLAYKARLMNGVHGLHRGDVVLMPAPLAHISGLLNGIAVPGAQPFTTVLMERWDPERALDVIARERVSFMVGPPTFFLGLMGSPRFTPEHVRPLRLVSSGGAGVTPAFVRQASDALGARVKRSYGSTEAPTVATSTADDPAERAAETDGRAVGGAQLRLGRDEELLVRGPELFAGYADPAQTRAALDRGWFRTGDRATIDGDGWLTIVGRLTDTIIRGGENISAAEVEGVLEAHPDVRQAVVVGYPDERLGERVCAFVVGAGGFDLERCREWFTTRGVTRFKTPERVVVLEALPLLASGKPDRAALRIRALTST